MKNCATCTAEFLPKRCDQRFCSRPCNQKFHRDSSTETCNEAGCERPRRAKDLCSTHYNRAYHQGSQQRWPGDPERRRRQLRTRTQRRRALTRDAEADAVDRDVVGERDGWKCGICRRKVNRALPYPHPKSPSLDHVIPLAEHGPHRYANCRIAHLDCNNLRSNRGGNEQLALVG